MSTATAELVKIPGKPAPLLRDEDVKVYLSFTWTLRYKVGQAHCWKNFYFVGSMTDARCRAYEHCGKMGYKFISIRRFIVDLDMQEEYKQTNGVDVSEVEEGDKL